MCVPMCTVWSLQGLSSIFGSLQKLRSALLLLVLCLQVVQVTQLELTQQNALWIWRIARFL